MLSYWWHDISVNLGILSFMLLETVRLEILYLNLNLQYVWNFVNCRFSEWMVFAWPASALSRENWWMGRAARRAQPADRQLGNRLIEPHARQFVFRVLIWWLNRKHFFHYTVYLSVSKLAWKTIKKTKINFIIIETRDDLKYMENLIIKQQN